MNDQLSMLSELDRASDTREPNLCRTWKNAVFDPCGIFWENMMSFRAQESHKIVTIHVALEYPKAYYSFTICGSNAGGGEYPRRTSENFDVHDHASNVMLMVEHSLASHIGKDKTMQRLMREALDAMEESIKE